MQNLQFKSYVTLTITRQMLSVMTFEGEEKQL